MNYAPEPQCKTVASVLVAGNSNMRPQVGETRRDEEKRIQAERAPKVALPGLDWKSSKTYKNSDLASEMVDVEGTRVPENEAESKNICVARGKWPVAEDVVM
jgi:hypothetical protein